jgi:aspartate/glutamate racemase
MDELLNNLFLPETRTKILSIAQRMKNEDGIEALVLAGTELPLLLRGSSTPGISRYNHNSRRSHR